MRVASISLFGLLLPLAIAVIMPAGVAEVGSPPAQSFDLGVIRRDLQKIDAYVSDGEVSDNDSVIVGMDIKVRDIYQGYLWEATEISGNLLTVRQQMARNNNNLSLQQLGALSQDIAAKNKRFRKGFTHGEDEFESYQLIDTAIHNLQDAITYWRVANKYRALYRGSKIERAEDDEVLQIRLQKAMSAIDELNLIMEMRRKLEEDLDEND